ncbi:MAG: hypothetical protein HY303_16275 [Candidatus Wallbacteria bacterium]|nr:hypothetical protein [Candidatus Wallbacteria bacterium]
MKNRPSVPQNRSSEAARSRSLRAGQTLFDVLIGAVVLVLVAVPVALLLTSSSRSIRSTDMGRETRQLMDAIMRRIESTDLTMLWDGYGVEPDSPGRLTGQLAEFVPGGVPGRNPLCLDRELLQRIAELGLECSLEFRFMTNKELGIDPVNRLKSRSGLLHLQAGVARLLVQGKLENRPFREEFVKPIYCPMILGRPGLLLSQCPAVNPALRDGKFKDMP